MTADHTYPHAPHDPLRRPPATSATSASAPGAKPSAERVGFALRLSLVAATAISLCACATQPGTPGGASPALPLPSVYGSTDPVVITNEATPAPPEVATATAAAPLDLARRTSAQNTESGIGVAGAPSDPLEPGNAILLGSADARADLWQRIRDGYGMPNLESGLVTEHEQWYAARPDYVARMTERGSRYLYHIVEEVNRRKIPTELALLPFIESAFNPQAMSSARASGMWQFMPATGKDFALKQNMFRDDRRDVLSSTRAALDYLERLKGKFGDWHLALAAYNWGEGNVQRAIDRNQRAGLPTDYLSLNMPAETRHYVPKLQAVKNIVTSPRGFGLALNPLQNHPHFLSVPIQRDIDVSLAARLAGMTSDEFKTLNPQHNKPVILAAGTPQVLLPYDNADRFVKNLASHRGQLASWTAWVVPRTMKSGLAAQEIGMSEEALRDVNRIPAKMLVKAGSTLLIERHDNRHQDVSMVVADNAQMQLAPEPPPFRRIGFKARRGDSVASIARQYHLNPADVARLNPAAANGQFKRGQAITLNVPNGAPKPVHVAQVSSRERAEASEREAPVRTAMKRDRKGRLIEVVVAERPAAQAKSTARASAAERRAERVASQQERLGKAGKAATTRVASRTVASARKPDVARSARLSAGTAGRLKGRRD